jgi:hypothetical protein
MLRIPSAAVKISAAVNLVGTVQRACFPAWAFHLKANFMFTRTYTTPIIHVVCLYRKQFLYWGRLDPHAPWRPKNSA